MTLEAPTALGDFDSAELRERTRSEFDKSAGMSRSSVARAFQRDGFLL